MALRLIAYQRKDFVLTFVFLCHCFSEAVAFFISGVRVTEWIRQSKSGTRLPKTPTSGT